MSVWQPAKAGLDALPMAIHQLVRHLLIPGSAVPPAVPDSEGWYVFTLAGGRQAAVKLKPVVRSSRQWGPRAVVAYDILGQAMLDREGFALTGLAVIDTATKAFLEVDCHLNPMGQVA
jgi:hypothetical protein